MSRRTTGVIVLALGTAALIGGTWRGYIRWVGSPEAYMLMAGVLASEHPSALTAEHDAAAGRLSAARGGDAAELARREAELAAAAEHRGQLNERWDKRVLQAGKLELILALGGIVVGGLLAWIGWERVNSPAVKTAEPNAAADGGGR